MKPSLVVLSILGFNFSIFFPLSLNAALGSPKMQVFQLRVSNPQEYLRM